MRHDEIEFPEVSRPTGTSHAILAICAGLIAIGVLMAVSTITELQPRTNQAWWQLGVVRQTAFSLMAVVVLLVANRLDYRMWCKRDESLYLQRATWLLILMYGLLAAVLVVGVKRNGAQRWLSLGPASLGLGFQPSEFCKPALVLFVAAFLTSRREQVRSFAGLLPLLLVIGAALGLVGLEDFGTSALLAMVCAAMLWYGGARRWHLVLCALPGIVGMAGLVAMKPYRLQRLVGFMNVENDPQGKGYHAMQSLITIASGGWWGQGLGAGVQKYGYLPEARSDFVFSVVCEELGLLGGFAIIALFIAFLWQGRRAMVRAKTDLGRLVALGATLTIGIQAAMNIGVVTVSLPTKGIALPFVSAGGSSVLFLSFVAGLLANVARERVRRPARGAFPVEPAAEPDMPALAGA